MAAIKDYTTQEGISGPISSASEAGEAASGVYAGLASGLHSVGEAVLRFNEQQESSKLSVAASAAHAKLTNEWEDLKTNGDITDPETVAKFNDHVAEVTSQLSSDIGSPSVANHAADLQGTINAGFKVKTLTDHATAVGAQAVTNIDTMVKNYSSSVYMDPHSLDETARLVGFSIAGSGIPQNKVPELTLKATKVVAQSAVEGMIENGSPQKALEELARGSYDKYLDGPEKTALVSKANSAVRAQNADERAAEAEARRQEKELAQKASNDIIGKMPVDDKGHVQVYPGAMQEALKIKDSETQRATTDFLRSVQSAAEHQTPPVSDPQTYDNLRQRIFDPNLSRTKPVDQNELMRAVADGKLDDKDFNFLRNGLSGADDPATKQYNSDVQRVLTGYKSAITDSSLIKVNQFGDQRYMEFSRDVSDYAAATFKRDGAGAKNAVEAYARSRVPAYQRPTDANIQATIDRVTSPLAPLPPVPKGVVPRLPGETLDAWMKRKGG